MGLFSSEKGSERVLYVLQYESCSACPALVSRMPGKVSVAGNVYSVRMGFAELVMPG